MNCSTASRIRRAASTSAQEALADREERLARPRLEPVDDRAVDERGELARSGCGSRRRRARSRARRAGSCALCERSTRSSACGSGTTPAALALLVTALTTVSFSSAA